jgi:polysaccharide export outer membrane protein
VVKNQKIQDNYAKQLNQLNEVNMKKLRNYSILLAIISIFIITQTATAADQPTVTDKNAYRIDSGDILEITTWKEPDFSREEILVRIDGKITFPLLNDIQAADRTPTELKQEIETKLKAYVDSPVVTVIVRSPGSQRFYILGEVVRTGEYPIVKDLTVLQAFALAGGFTEWASKSEILLFREENGQQKTIRINYKNIVKGKDFDQNVKIKANDTIIVP